MQDDDYLEVESQQPAWGGCLLWMGRAALVTFGLALFLGLLGSIYESITFARIARLYPPPGQLVEAGRGELGAPYRLHLYCTGQGNPAVILAAASGAWSLDWSLVQPQVARFTRVCSYDRAGYGWSDSSPRPRTSQHIAEELFQVLQNAAVEGPYLLVGHSFGGHTVRLLAHEHSAQVSGMVLVDARPEDIGERMPELREMLDRSISTYELLGPLARLGLFQLSAFENPPQYVDGFPPKIQEQYRAIDYQEKFFDALAGEGAAMPESDAQVRTAGSFGDLPLVVITHDVPDWFPPGMEQGERDRAEPLCQEQQGIFSEKLSSNGKLVVAQNTGHAIPETNPQVVVEAIRQMMSKITQGP